MLQLEINRINLKKGHRLQTVCNQSISEGSVFIGFWYFVEENVPIKKVT